MEPNMYKIEEETVKNSYNEKAKSVADLTEKTVQKSAKKSNRTKSVADLIENEPKIQDSDSKLSKINPKVQDSDLELDEEKPEIPASAVPAMSEKRPELPDISSFVFQ